MESPFPSRLRYHRELLGLTRAQLAERLSCHVDTIKYWETYRRSPPTSRLAEIAGALRVNPSTLLDPLPETGE